MNFYKCTHCGNIIMFLENKGVPVMCCGEKMSEITANSVDASKEKHTPVVSKDNNIVNVLVGQIEHPMEEKHLIQWVAVETNERYYIEYLKDKPFAQFTLADGENVKSVYAYCNLHGLWKI